MSGSHPGLGPEILANFKKKCLYRLEILPMGVNVSLMISRFLLFPWDVLSYLPGMAHIGKLFNYLKLPYPLEGFLLKRERDEGGEF